MADDDLRAFLRSFAVVIATMTTMTIASHADTVDDLLQELRQVSGPRDITGLIIGGRARSEPQGCERFLTVAQWCGAAEATPSLAEAALEGEGDDHLSTVPRGQGR
jgi:hypothetical protein